MKLVEEAVSCVLLLGLEGHHVSSGADHLDSRQFYVGFVLRGAFLFKRGVGGRPPGHRVDRGGLQIELVGLPVFLVEEDHGLGSEVVDSCLGSGLDHRWVTSLRGIWCL